MVPRATRGRVRRVHAVRGTNRGSGAEPVARRASDPESVLRFTLPGGEVPLQPGTAQVDVAVQAPGRILGRPRAHPFQVVVVPRPELSPLRLDGSREVVPLIARWVPIVTAVAVLLSVLGALAPRVIPRLTEQGRPPQGTATAPPLPAGYPELFM